MTTEQIFSVDAGENAEPGSIGVRVLVVDCDSTCLAILSKMLHVFGYKAVIATRATDALHILRERQEELDLILTEIHLPDMDKYELLETMMEMSCLPIVVLSADDNENAMLGCLFKGAAFYFVKPITISDVKNLWQFSYMKKQQEIVVVEGSYSSQGESTPENTTNDEALEHLLFSDTSEQGAQKCKRKQMEEIDKHKYEDKANLTPRKKPKLIWTSELHDRFLRAIRILGIDSAHPKKILKHMNVPGLKKENISSHLQKYRLSLKREQDAIRKTMVGDYHISSFNLQRETTQFWKPKFLMTSQPEFKSYGQNPKNLSSSVFMPSFGYADFPIHSNHSNISMPTCGKAAQQRDEIYSSYSSCNHGGNMFNVSSNEKFGSFGQMGNVNDEEFFKHGMTVSNVGNFGFGFSSVTDGVQVLRNSSTQQQPFLLSPLPPPPPPSPLPLREKEKDEIFENERDELELFTQMLVDEAYNNIW